MWKLLDVPFAAASPSVASSPCRMPSRRQRWPDGSAFRRIVTILEGESLFNDATALVTVRAAILGIAGTVTLAEVGVDFLRAAIGGIVVGLAIAWVVGRIRKAVTDTTTDTALSFIAPWLAYLPAELVHASGVLAVVVCGILLGHKAPIIQSAQSRIAERLNWTTIQYLLENAVFLIIGLQSHLIVVAVSRSEFGLGASIALVAVPCCSP